MKPVSSWGRLSAEPHDVVEISDISQLAGELYRCGTMAPKSLAHGMGRSYGDVCLNPGGRLWRMSGLNRVLDFDPVQGRIVCEAGVLLRDIQQLAVPHGWMLPVTPGTQLVSVGGAIANDVHGKNHHRHGTFGHHVEQLTLLRSDAEPIVCGPHERPDWFAASVGGLGLTGVITQAAIRLQRVPGPWLQTETIPYTSLDEFFQLADASEAGWEHTVSWIDCLSPGRGLFLRANPVATDRSPPAPTREFRIGWTPPVSLINRLSLRPFNLAYYRLKQRRRGPMLEHYASFFYPLDKLLEWNRIYGPRGFYQYQSVVPRASGPEAIAAMLAEIRKDGSGSFLAVLKTFGEREPVGLLSFARAGVTLALDFPNACGRTLQLFERLDAIVRAAGGRLYPAKDARMPRELFESGYSRLPAFLRYRDPGLSSALSRRLMND